MQGRTNNSPLLLFRDYAAREQLETPLRRLTALMEKMNDTKKLLDFDNFQTTLTYYR